MSAPTFSGRWRFLGDVHKRIEDIPLRGSPIVQVGDLGVGFARPSLVRRLFRRRDFWFIRGNHDDPAQCRAAANYLGDFGGDKTLFWVSGAGSIDRASRIEGRDWWAEEELTSAQARRALDDYVAARPRVLVSHDGPEFLFRPGGPMSKGEYIPTRTTQLLQAMLEVHAPALWIFGHHHVSRDFRAGGTRFRCLAELETCEVDFGCREECRP